MRRDVCDCGLAKDPRAEACDRCLLLDGERDADRDFITALRGLGGAATAADLERRLPVNKRFLLRVAARLIAAGRVVRKIGEGETTDNWRGWRDPVFVLVEHTPDQVTGGEGQLVFGRPGFARSCKHERSFAVETMGGDCLCRVCSACNHRDQPPAPEPDEAWESWSWDHVQGELRKTKPKVCKHTHRIPVQTEGGEVLAWQCTACHKLVAAARGPRPDGESCLSPAAGGHEGGETGATSAVNSLALISQSAAFVERSAA